MDLIPLANPAALGLGVGRRTVGRRMKDDPDFPTIHRINGPQLRPRRRACRPTNKQLIRRSLAEPLCENGRRQKSRLGRRARSRGQNRQSPPRRPLASSRQFECGRSGKLKLRRSARTRRLCEAMPPDSGNPPRVSAKSRNYPFCARYIAPRLRAMFADVPVNLGEIAQKCNNRFRLPVPLTSQG